MTDEEFEYRLWEAEGAVQSARERWAEGEHYEAEADLMSAGDLLRHFAAAIGAPCPYPSSDSDEATAPF